VELEDLAEDDEVVGGRPVEVEPEEAAAREQLLDGLAGEVDLAVAVPVDDVAGPDALALRLHVRAIVVLASAGLDKSTILDILRSVDTMR
jgi:hypothetical protein